MKVKRHALCESLSRNMFLVAILAVLSPYSLLNVKVTRAQTETTLSAPVLTATAAGSNAIELSWTSVPGAVSYVLYVQLVAAPGWQQLGGGNLQGTSYRHAELTPGRTYQYAVARN